MKTIFYILLFIILTFLVFVEKITEDGAIIIFMCFFIIPFLTKILSKKKR